MTYKLCLRGGKCNLTKQIYAEKLHLKIYLRNNQFEINLPPQKVN